MRARRVAGYRLAAVLVSHAPHDKPCQCKTCHTPDAISKIYHVSVDPTGSKDRGGYPANTANNVPTPGYPSGQGPPIPLASSTNPPAGVPKVAFEISSVTVAANAPTIKYRILFDGVPVTFQPTWSRLPP